MSSCDAVHSHVRQRALPPGQQQLGFRVTAGQSARWNRLASSGHSAVTVSDTYNTVRIACTGRFHQSIDDMLGVSPGELESEWRIVRRLEGDLSLIHI